MEQSSGPTSDASQRVALSDYTALGLSLAVLHWCSPEEIERARASLQIPVDAQHFDEELLYLYVFLALTSVEIAYRDNDSFRISLAKTFFDHIHEAIASGDALAFRASPETMSERYMRYLKLQDRGIEALIEQLPFSFLVTNGLCRSESRDDMDAIAMPLLSMQLWVGGILKQLLSVHQQWREKYGI